MFIKLDCNTFADRMAEDFSRDAALALFDWLEELEAGGEEQEFDRIAIRCEFSEYESAIEAAKEYGFSEDALEGEDDETETPEEREERLEKSALEWLNRRTSVIEFEGGVIIGNF